MSNQDKTFEAWRKRLIRKFGHSKGSFTAVCGFPNDDVPKFLKRLDEFERQSAKTKVMVRGSN